MPPVQPNPQPLEELRQRYPKALEYVFDARTIVENNGIRPGECAANVFDFEDGLRMIISRERLLDGKVVIHFSTSLPKYCRLAMRVRREKIILERWIEIVTDIFRELSGDNREIRYIGRTASVSHWMIEELKMKKRLEDMNEPEIRDLMNHVGASILKAASEAGMEGNPLFALILFNDPKLGQYVANCTRESMIEALKEAVRRLESNEDVTR